MFKMPYLTLGAVALLFFVSSSSGLLAQDDELELGMLPELPYLDLGNPDTKPTWHEKRARQKNLDAQRRAEESLNESRGLKAGSTPAPTFAERLASNKSQSARKGPLSNTISVRNSLPAGEEGITASGVRLRPFGDDNYWGGMPAIPIEETLIDLPPLPDLRVPDQVTRRERARDKWVAKQEVKKAEADADRERREFNERMVVSPPAQDPSSALVQVQSQSGSGAPYVGNAEAPETLRKGQLKPFNASSSYYKDNQVVYKGPGKTGGTPGVRWGWGSKNKEEAKDQTSTR